MRTTKKTNAESRDVGKSANFADFRALLDESPDPAPIEKEAGVNMDQESLG